MKNKDCQLLSWEDRLLLENCQVLSQSNCKIWILSPENKKYGQSKVCQSQYYISFAIIHIKNSRNLIGFRWELCTCRSILSTMVYFFNWTSWIIFLILLCQLTLEQRIQINHWLFSPSKTIDKRRLSWVALFRQVMSIPI